MKKLLILTVALSLPLAQSMRADDARERKNHKRPAEAAEGDRGQQSAQPAAPVARRPVQQPQRSARPTASVVRQPGVTNQASREGRNRSDTPVANRENTRDRNVDRTQTDSQVSVQRNRGKRDFNRNSFNVACSRVIRTPHNRNWWRNHYNTTFVIFGGGYYYWSDNYWFPAYGYDPYYNNYIYSEPIYGYDNLAPGQVIENVQIALRDEGYYLGAIDGLVGAQTRAALSAYQRDHGLIVTAAVDEPTLVTLGLA